MLCVQGKGILQSQRPLPSLPSNARYVYHDNVCYDWGTFGFALDNSVPDVAIYKYIVFMNSSIRGPHLPAYWPVSLHSTNNCLFKNRHHPALCYCLRELSLF